MICYRRAWQAGGCYFFTVALADRGSGLLTEQVNHLRECFRRVQTRHPFTVEAAVILPDHLHCIWTLPEHDARFDLRWGLIKSSFSRGIAGGERRSGSRIGRGERGLWQRRFWEHLIRDERDLRNHVDYIHINPVKHGQAAKAIDWPHSSIHRYVREGRCDSAWAAEAFVWEMELE